MSAKDEFESYVAKFPDAIVVPIEMMRNALQEIEFLRSRAGAITQGSSFDDIARRQGRQSVATDPETGDGI